MLENNIEQLENILSNLFYDCNLSEEEILKLVNEKLSDIQIPLF